MNEHLTTPREKSAKKNDVFFLFFSFMHVLSVLVVGASIA